MKEAFEKMTGMPDAWTNPALMVSRNAFIQGWEAALAQPEQEPVVLHDDEIYDAAYAAYCRGENSRELFRIMWNSRLTCSIGWDRDELKSFARNIAAIYIHPREKN
jgi:hypothetical protein